MWGYVLRRVLYMVPALFFISVVAFGVIKLNPGDFLTKYELSYPREVLQEMRERYGLDAPLHVQYWRWITGILTRLDFGYSFATRQPALQALFSSGRLLWTFVVTGVTMLCTWLLALPLGIYSATHRNSLGDRLANLLGFIGLSIPSFVLALVLLWALVVIFQVGPRYGLGVGGLFDPAQAEAAWSWAKVKDLLWHLWPAVLVIGAGNIASLSRYMRGQLLDVLDEPYIQAARAKGLRERLVVYKHAVRNALTPLVSMLGFWLPQMFEGTLVAAVVLQLPIVEGAYWQALAQEDQYVAMSGLLFFSAVLMVGSLLADLLLLWVDPRIRLEK
ncbi:MAG: ABC transporter permease [Candidatus Acetothermia bacterium]|jgi:peptide/nickel transport system permease protein|nr:ABC transporter permease [Candidatus Acetothermia bacterium]